MNTFRPSPAFQAFFNTVIATAEAPVTAGTFVLAIPTFPDPRETIFAERFLIPLLSSINAMKASVTPVPAPNPYALDPSSGQPLYPEMWGTTSGAP